MTAPRLGEPPIHQPYPGAPFGVAFVRFWKKGFTFTGRASRSEYWKAYVATVGIVAVLYIVAVIITAVAASSYSQGAAGFGGFLMIVALLYALATLVPSLAAVVRRLHDGNQSGAMYFISLIPFVGGIILLVLLAQQSNPVGARFDVGAQNGWVAPNNGANRAAQGTFTTSLPVPPPPPAAFPTAPAYAPVVPRGASVPPVPPPPAPSAALRPVPPIPSPAPVASPFIVPTPAPAPATAQPPRAAAMPFASDDLDSTRMAAPLAAATWIVRMPDGRSIPASGSVFFGRAPSSDNGTDATLVPVDDVAKSMSKTHARIDAVANTLRVTDLHSTNGTTVTVGGNAVSLVPGDPFTLTADATVRFGDYEITVQRNVA